MVYFTDLDRTLIYSKKFIDEKLDYISIEKNNNEDISFITKRSIHLIRTIQKNNLIIPTTTRNIEQYNRIDFYKNNIEFPMAIVCNGGCILYKGQRMKLWDEFIGEELRNCEELRKIKEIVLSYGKLRGVEKVRDVYNMFFYMVVNKKVFREKDLQEIRDCLESYKWNIYLSGRKIYFIPEIIRKEVAINFLLQYLKEENYSALGDSIMDLNMLEFSRKAFIPRNSYLMDYKFKNEKYISEKAGLASVEEILEEILREL